jgi:transcriptional regulator GlxA family with amidase domain
MNFGILIFPDVEELDFVGPWEFAKMWALVAKGSESVHLIAQTTSAVRCAKGMRVLPDHSFESCPKLDYLLVPGGQGTRAEVDNKPLIDFIKTQTSTCSGVLSVCTGSFLLHAAGQLAGKRATTHWGSLSRLRALGDAEVVEDRFTHDGKVWTSAGVSAGMDLMLAFIAHVAGEDAAGRVQFAAEYYPNGKVYGNYTTHEKAPGYIRQDKS